MKIPFFAALAALLFSGCASTSDLTPDRIAQETTVAYDQARQETAVTGPFLSYQSVSLGSGKFLLRAFKAANKKTVVFQLYVENIAPDWESFSNATANDQATLPVVPIDSNQVQVGDATQVSEKFGMEVPKGVLERSSDGLTVKLYGKDGVLEISVPAVYIKGFMSRVN